MRASQRPLPKTEGLMLAVSQTLGLTERPLDEEWPGQAGKASCSCSEGGKESRTGQTPLGIEQLIVALHLGGRDRSIA